MEIISEEIGLRRGMFLQEQRLAELNKILMKKLNNFFIVKTYKIDTN